MIAKSRCRTGLQFSAAAAALLAFTAPMVVVAQQATYTFDIPAQDLGSALRAYARATRQQVSFSGQTVRGKQSAALEGSFAADDALGRLLVGSGLTFSRSSRGVILVSSQVGRAAGRGSLSGRVVEGDVQRRLAGAVVRLEATGETTTTNDNGEFRFTNVAAGPNRLVVSFLGYPTQAVDATVQAGQIGDYIVLFGIAQIEDVTVTGQRGARALALNIERTAENSSTVISADLLGNFNGTTISDALRRAPGISFLQDPATGDGRNIVVRGLSPDYNQVTVNGAPVTGSLGTDRTANLNNFLADSASEIRISKTLLPNQQSAGTGGLVEIETRSPLNRGDRTFNFGGEQLRRGDGFGADELYSLTAGTHLTPSFGVLASVQYRGQDLKNYGYALSGIPGPYLPLGANGQAADQYDLDPRTRLLFQEGAADYYLSSVQSLSSEIESETLSITASAEWQVNSSTNLRLDALRTSQDSSRFQAYGLLNSITNYALQPIQSLGGELRYAPTMLLPLALSSNGFNWQDGHRETSTAVSLRGVTERGAWTYNYRASYSAGEFDGGDLLDGSVSVPGAFLVEGDLLPEAVDPVLGYAPSLYGRRQGSAYPLPLLSGSGLAKLDRIANATLSSAGTTFDREGESEAYVVAGSVKYAPGNWLNYLELGADYQSSRFFSTNGVSDFYLGLGNSAAGLGLEFQPFPLAPAGPAANVLGILDKMSAERLRDQLSDLGASGEVLLFPGTADPLGLQAYTEEVEVAPYLQGRLDIGDVEVIGGVRMSRVTVDAGFTNAVTYVDEEGVIDRTLYDSTRKLITASATQTDWLPRVLVNYRPSENLVFRAGYFSTVARPQVQQLSTAQSIFYNAQPFGGPLGNQPYLLVSVGNPDLEPAKTHNVDVSVEWYQSDIGVFKLSAFYKRIDNLLEANTTGQVTDLAGIQFPADPRFTPANFPSNLYIEVTKPVNNPDPGEIWGVEVAAEKRLSFLPGVFSGLGVYANYTWSESQKNQPGYWTTAPVYDVDGVIIDRRQVNYLNVGIPFQDQPEHSGTVGLTYTGYGFDGSLFFTTQSALKGTATEYFEDYTAAVSSLDLRLQYSFDVKGGQARIYLEGRDLLKGRHDAATQRYLDGPGGDDVYTQGYFTGGRRVTIGLGFNF